MWLIFYKISDNYFVIEPVDFSIYCYDDLEVGYISRDGYMLVFMIIYNVYKEETEIVYSYWLWRQCIKLQHG